MRRVQEQKIARLSPKTQVTRWIINRIIFKTTSTMPILDRLVDWNQMLQPEALSLARNIREYILHVLNT